MYKLWQILVFIALGIIAILHASRTNTYNMPVSNSRLSKLETIEVIANETPERYPQTSVAIRHAVADNSVSLGEYSVIHRIYIFERDKKL